MFDPAKAITFLFLRWKITKAHAIMKGDTK
jgi:hypothetical protein